MNKGIKFDVIKAGKTTFKDQLLEYDPSGDSSVEEREKYVNALKWWPNILSEEKNQWADNFDFLLVAGHLIAKGEILSQIQKGGEIMKGIAYDENGKLIFYKTQREF